MRGSKKSFAFYLLEIIDVISKASVKLQLALPINLGRSCLYLDLNPGPQLWVKNHSADCTTYCIMPKLTFLSYFDIFKI